MFLFLFFLLFWRRVYVVSSEFFFVTVWSSLRLLLLCSALLFLERDVCTWTQSSSEASSLSELGCEKGKLMAGVNMIPLLGLNILFPRFLSFMVKDTFLWWGEDKLPFFHWYSYPLHRYLQNAVVYCWPCRDCAHHRHSEGEEYVSLHPSSCLRGKNLMSYLSSRWRLLDLFQTCCLFVHWCSDWLENLGYRRF